MLRNAGRKTPKLFSRRQHQVPVRVIFTPLCAGGLVGESQMLVLFTASLGLHLPLSVRGNLVADFSTPELGLLGSAAEIVLSSYQVASL